MTLRAGTFVRLSGGSIKLTTPTQATVAHPPAHVVAQTTTVVRMVTGGSTAPSVPTIGQLWPRRGT